MILLLLFVLLPTLLLAASFGIAYPLVNFARRNLDDWKTESNSLRKLFYIGLLWAILWIGIGFVVLDWFVNVVFATAFFRDQPEVWTELLTDRIQRYLVQWRDGRQFDKIERAYIRFVVRVANAIDQSPHFCVPKGTV